MKLKLLLVAALLLCNLLQLHSQNLLNTSTWKVGSGAVTGFALNGSVAENSRVLGKNHVGKQVVLWKASPDATSNADGGWNTSWHTINANTTYRFSVWLKKTNSLDGSSYLGFYANNNKSLTLDNVFHKNPYFWYGKLPKLNRWYLVVGYVHKATYNSTKSLGAIYDGTTGKIVSRLKDFKFGAKANAVRHRSYLFYDQNTLDEQYFWQPRIDPINGKEPTINQLLQIHQNSKVVMSYDAAYNQKRRFYCPDANHCSPPLARKQLLQTEHTSSELNKKEVVTETFTEKQLENTSIVVYPNPTTGITNLRFNTTSLTTISSIQLFTINATLLQTISKSVNTLIDLSTYPKGIYILQIRLTNGKNVIKKIIKN